MKILEELLEMINESAAVCKAMIRFYIKYIEYAFEGKYPPMEIGIPARYLAHWVFELHPELRD